MRPDDPKYEIAVGTIQTLIKEEGSMTSPKEVLALVKEKNPGGGYSVYGFSRHLAALSVPVSEFELSSFEDLDTKV
ncbi:MAG: hypothetical protein R2861_10560 [Desulfobacterales bacterium]